MRGIKATKVLDVEKQVCSNVSVQNQGGIKYPYNSDLVIFLGPPDLPQTMLKPAMLMMRDYLIPSLALSDFPRLKRFYEGKLPSFGGA